MATTAGSEAAGRTEQVISQFLLKVLHAVLGARVPDLHADGGVVSPAPDAGRGSRRDRWFNLALGDLPAAIDRPDLWRHGISEPMIIDITIYGDIEAVVERWRVQCEPVPGAGAGAGVSSADPSSVSRMYKRSMLLLRSLYSVLRLLPAYRVFRKLRASSCFSTYGLSFRVSSFAMPFTREEERDLKHYFFAPVETRLGSLSLSVAYRPKLPDFDLDAAPPHLPPVIITDYVGSPAADPFRSFPSSDRGVRAISLPLRTPVPPSASTRPHSWTSAPAARHPLSSSPSSDPILSPQDVYGQKRRPMQPPSSAAAVALRKSGWEEFRLSPPFSTPSTPSPPGPGHSTNAMLSRLHPETSPVSIPLSSSEKGKLHGNPNLSDPTRVLLPPPSPRNWMADPSLQESPSRKMDTLRIGDRYSNLQWHAKGFKDGKDDSGRFSGAFSSSGSPRFGFSRCSSQLSAHNDPDDDDFSCPFAVDDIDALGSQPKKDGLDSANTVTSSRRSQDAAVGVLIHMLKTAPSLRSQDASGYSSQSLHSQPNPTSTVSSAFGVASRLFSSRRASDAMDELQSYRDMKDMLVSKKGTQL